MALTVLLSSGRLSVSAVAELTTAAARILRLAGKGRIEVGADADLALVDPDASWQVSAATTWTRHRANPFMGMELTSRVVCTLVRGHVVYSLENGPAAPGWGRVVRPQRVTK
jgi:allantoinase